MGYSVELRVSVSSGFPHTILYVVDNRGGGVVRQRHVSCGRDRGGRNGAARRECAGAGRCDVGLCRADHHWKPQPGRVCRHRGSVAGCAVKRGGK